MQVELFELTLIARNRIINVIIFLYQFLNQIEIFATLLNGVNYQQSIEI